MTIEKALSIFDIDTISDTDATILKKKYKKLMIKYHPDNCGDSNAAADVSIAYKIIKDAIDEINKFKESLNSSKTNSDCIKAREIIIIPLSSVVSISSGNTIKVSNSIKSYELNTSTVKEYNTFVMVALVVNHGYESENVNKIVPYDYTYNRKYDIDCKIIVDELGTDEKVDIKIDKKDYSFTFRGSSCKIMLKLDGGVKVNVTVNKILRK